jgi:hypothetical protein
MMAGPKDEEMEAFLHTRTIKPPVLKCGSGNTIIRYCINKGCRVDASCCGIDLCKSCEGRHKDCHMTDLDRLTKRAQAKQALNKSAVYDISKM